MSIWALKASGGAGEVWGQGIFPGGGAGFLLPCLSTAGTACAKSSKERPGTFRGPCGWHRAQRVSPVVTLREGASRAHVVGTLDPRRRVWTLPSALETTERL